MPRALRAEDDPEAAELTPLAALPAEAEVADSLLRGATQTHHRRASDRHPSPTDAVDPTATAAHLLHRQETLDRTLGAKDASTLSGLLNRSPPSPIALLVIQSDSTRDRFARLLHNANIDTESSTPHSALGRMLDEVPAILFTDQLELLNAARQLESGSATHMVFINGSDGVSESEALKAGANEIVSPQATGEHFWAHMTTVRRIISFATSLQSAVTGNRILSTIDALTQCGNRRFFEEQFPREVARAARVRQPLSLIMCDIDLFKKINDHHGHHTGDEVLREFGARLTGALRLEQDWAARIGGEEFAVVLPETGGPEAVAIARRLCARVNSTPFTTAAGPIAVTASFGTSGLTDGAAQPAGQAERMILAADSALYASKRAGRNRVTEHSVKSDA